MTNPTPRPALRKAGDADVHPAAPRPTRSPRSRTAPRTDTSISEPAPAAAVAALPAPEGKPVAKKAPAKPRSAATATPSKRRERKFSGNTSDHMRVADSTENAEVAAPAPSAPRSAPKPAPKPAAVAPAAPAPAQPAPATESSAPSRTTKSAGAELLKGRSVELEVHVPKALRKAARAEAKKRGLDIDTVVVDLLHAWLIDPR